MKKLFLISIILVIAIMAYADDTKPAADKPYILVNTYTDWPWLHATNGGFKQFALAAKAEGYDINHTKLVNYLEEHFDGVDIFILPTPKSNLLAEDKAVLKQFILNGGSLLMLLYPNSIPDLSNIGSFTKQFGIWVKSRSSGFDKYDVVQGTQFTSPYPCTKITGTHSVVSFNYDATQATPILTRGTDGIVGLVSFSKNLGKGKLVVIGSDEILYNPTFTNNPDNQAFTMNVLNYLSGSIDFQIRKVKVKGRNHLAGDTVKVIVKIKNKGNRDSDPALVKLFLTDDGTLSPADTLSELGTFEFPEIAAGKKGKVTYSVEIPDWYGPGEYWVVAVVDPDNESGDQDITNNTKKAKKALLLN